MSFVGSKILSDQEQIQRVIDIGLSEDVGTGDVSCLGTRIILSTSRVRELCCSKCHVHDRPLITSYNHFIIL